MSEVAEIVPPPSRPRRSKEVPRAERPSSDVLDTLALVLRSGGPGFCQFAVTNACNANCGFCNFARDRLAKEHWQYVERQGALDAIDILVNNAGTSWGAPTIEHSLEGWNKVITLNVTAMFVVSQAVGRRCMLPRRSGKVINIASIQGLTGCYPEGVPTLAYNASKGAVVNITRTLANEWAPFAS